MQINLDSIFNINPDKQDRILLYPVNFGRIWPICWEAHLLRWTRRTV